MNNFRIVDRGGQDREGQAAPPAFEIGQDEPRDSRSQAGVGNVAAKSLVSCTYAVNRERLGAPPR
jgi:hypothetical protein